MPNIPKNSPWRFSATKACAAIERNGLDQKTVITRVVSDGFQDVYGIKDILRGRRQPSLPVAFAIARAIEEPLEDLMEPVPLPTPKPLSPAVIARAQ